MAINRVRPDVVLMGFGRKWLERGETSRLNLYLRSKDMPPGQFRPWKLRIRSDPKFVPALLAFETKHREAARREEIRAEVRRVVFPNDVWPRDPEMLQELYRGIGHHQEGRFRYLKERNKLDPEAKYTRPITEYMEYGWKFRDSQDFTRVSQFNRKGEIERTFKTKNGIPTLVRHQTACEVVPSI